VLRKLALAAASTAFALVLLEGVLRVSGLELHDRVNDNRKYGALLVIDEERGYYRHPANASVRLQGVTLRFNSLGMRDDEPRVPKPPDVFRILCLGDSMALGPAVAQDAIYPARLRALLGSPTVDLVTGAAAGWNTVEEEHFLAANIDALAPDLVVLLYVTNDNDVVPPYRRERQPPVGWPSRLYRTLVFRSRLFEWGAYVYTARFASVDWETLREMAQWRREKGPAPLPFTSDDAGWQESLAALGRIERACAAHGARFVIFLWNVGNLFPAPTVLEGLKTFGEQHGVPVFDTWPFFRGQDLSALLNSSDDPHPNARGHALLAEGIARTLREQHLVRERSG